MPQITGKHNHPVGDLDSGEEEEAAAAKVIYIYM